MSTLPVLPIQPGPATNWTALQNFAALRGQLRVSLTPYCNIKCWFCHNEGDVPPDEQRNQSARARELCADQYVRLIAALVRKGLKRVYFTGGEPLTSPVAGEVLTNLTERAPDVTYTLITNGLLVPRKRELLAEAALDKIKVSLHYFSDESFAQIAKTRNSIARVLEGIEVAREVCSEVGLNTLLQRENEHEILPILHYALERRMPVQFIELVDTGFNADQKSSAVSAQGIIEHLRTLTSDERVEIAGVGQGRRVFRIDGVEVDVIHRGLGRHHVGQCGTCPVRPQCVEGLWALRVDHAGGVQPCLLREDLRLNVMPLIDDMDAATSVIADHLASFTEGTL
ncbi:molybdenum cofactor biosynthesis protein MoaA [Streptomyces agglomeratus]|uniref:radical SAM protein n=1 Tax=Streptomyces agglomeratus TaxID=285458 RepID=UPI00085275E9|nr:radical SAM protein [Streptomyces agglomeratus]OEJ57187.1 molybdenum cofactor biosynthesis protein MoaA [Streptomyces agglomeratus]